MSLASDDRTLDQLVQMAAESSEYPNADEAYATEEVRALASEFDDAVYAALEEVVRRYPPKGRATAEDLFAADGPYNILMTLRGEGVGIWDGRWEEFYDDTEEVERLLTRKLGKWADDTGGGKLEDAFQNAAYETAGGEEEDDEDEDDEGEYEENTRHRRNASRGVIGSRGIELPRGSHLRLQPFVLYPMGASDSPETIMVTRVGKDRFWYKSYPYQGRERVIEDWIGKDLIERGIRSELRSQEAAETSTGPFAQLAKSPSRLARKRELQSLLEGGPGKKVDPDDYRPVRIIARATGKGDYPRGDPWYGAEEYGSVGGIEEGGEMLYEIEGDASDAKAIKKDKRFKVLSVEDRPGRDEEY